jgi:hypothetical protein
MTVLHSQLNPRSADFQANAAAMRNLVDDLRVHLERVALGGGEAPAPSTPPGASCCRVTACRCCSTPARLFWKSRRWQR